MGVPRHQKISTASLCCSISAEIVLSADQLNYDSDVVSRLEDAATSSMYVSRHQPSKLLQRDGLYTKCMPRAVG